MTTTVKIEAHCTPDKEVLVIFKGSKFNPTKTLQDGEKGEFHVYDTLSIEISEVMKEKNV